MPTRSWWCGAMFPRLVSAAQYAWRVAVRTVGAHEAKTHLPRLLDEVARGETITITKHGVPVAWLMPPSEACGRSAREAIAALRAFRRGKTLGGLSVRDLIEDGRRY